MPTLALSAATVINALRSSGEPETACSAANSSSSTRSSTPSILAAEACASIASCSSTFTRSPEFDQRSDETFAVKSIAGADSDLNRSLTRVSLALASRDGSVIARRNESDPCRVEATTKRSALNDAAAAPVAPFTATSSAPRATCKDCRLLPPRNALIFSFSS